MQKFHCIWRMFFKTHYKGAKKKMEGILPNLAQVSLKIVKKIQVILTKKFFLSTLAIEILKPNVSIGLCFLGEISASKTQKCKNGELKVPTKT